MHAGLSKPALSQPPPTTTVTVPVPVFTALTPILIDGGVPCKRFTFDIRTCLTTLLDYNLLKGSLSAGVFLHDIVRDFTIAQLGEAGLREMQAQTTAALLMARPEGGWPTAEHADATTLEGYVARQLYWHMRGALVVGDSPPEAWIENEDRAVLRAVAAAVGFEGWKSLVAQEESASDYLRATKYLWVSSQLGDAGMVTR